MKDKIFQKLKEELPKIQKGVSLKNYTTYKIGGSAKYFFIVKNREELLNVIKLVKVHKLPIFILGGGSNILISDKGFKGLVIKIDITNIEFYPHAKRNIVEGKNIKKDHSRYSVGVEGNKAFIGAGVNLTKLAYLSADKGLSGLEWSAGMPGTLGGAVHGNAHAFGTKISDIIESVEVINFKTLELNNFTKKQCQFSLKNSIFKENKNLVIVSAFLEFKEKDVGKIKNQIKEFLEYRRTMHPMNFPSAGSVFVNAEKKVNNKKLLEKFSELNEYNKKGVIPSGYLIEKCGLAGKKIGKAQISEKHCNFIINLGGAKAKDVLYLINLAKKKVKKTFGISLKLEVQMVGF
jgi:UDP-N-acetylmuramate dehydrogenase